MDEKGGIKMRKTKNNSIFLMLLLTLFISACTNKQESEIRNVTWNNSFIVTPDEYKDSIDFTIHTNDFSLNQQREIEVNRLIRKVEDTNVILNKLYVREKDVLVTIKLESEINSTNGKFLSPYEFKTEGDETKLISTDVEINVYDENGQRLMEGGGITENEVTILIHKDDFKNSKELKVNINGLHLMGYLKK